jgi:hypothetical protein
LKGRDKRTVWGIILATLGITATGVYFGLHRFLWRLWVVVSGIWITLLLLFGFSPEMRQLTDSGTLILQEPWYWAIMLVPPLLLLLIAGLLSWIFSGLREDVAEPRSGHGSDNDKRAKRRELGYDE